MLCRFCGKDHVCAKPECGHNKYINHGDGKSVCTYRQHGALPGCHCNGYIESSEERECREQTEKDCQWAQDALKMIEQLFHAFNNGHLHMNSAEALECDICNGNIHKIIRRGKGLPIEHIPFPSMAGYEKYRQRIAQIRT